MTRCQIFHSHLIALFLLAILSACNAKAPEGAEAEGLETPTGKDGVSTAPLLDKIGSVNFPITTKSPRAQAYFNQAITLSYGFNHAEAARSFREAARLDPSCGICWWGVALVHGPNINKEMAPEDVPIAWEALGRATELRANESELEQALIDALDHRYSEDGDDRAAMDLDYAEVMADVAAEYPEDVHVQSLYAEAIMDTYPWDYWDDDGNPRARTPALVRALESVIAADPNHPGALHLYIHLMERFSPKLAEPAADRLGDLVPVAGHLVHMPSHIYLRVGRYHDAVIANEQAALADEDYISQCNAQGFYPAAYYPHNIHFLWYSAMMEGRLDLSVSSALKLREKVPLDMARQMGGIQVYLAVPAYTYVRFGMWQEALAIEEPPSGLIIATYMRHYARGMAFASLGNVQRATGELAAMNDIVAQGRFRAQMARQGDLGDQLASIAALLVKARIARANGSRDGEIEHLLQAVATQDSLPYAEPPHWHFPTRQALGAAYLAAGKPELAAAAFTEDLEYFPANGWSLQGLAEAQRALGIPSEETQAAAANAWRHSDIAPIAGSS